MSKYNYEGDDSSDEESEGAIYSSIPNIAKYNLTSKLKDAPSVLMQDLGMRILASDKTRAKYFPKKKIMGEFEQLSDTKVENVLRQSVEMTIENYIKTESHETAREIFGTKAYDKIKGIILSDHKKFFSLKTNKEISSLLHEMAYSVPKELYNSSATEAVYERHIKTEIDRLKPIILTTSQSRVTFSKAAKNKLLTYVKQQKDHSESNNYLEAVLESFLELETNIAISVLVSQATAKLKIRSEESFHDSLIEDMKKNLVLYSKDLRKEIIRPTLDDATSFSYQNLFQDQDDKTQDYSSSDFFSYLRMLHCSSKRFIKNAQADSNFSGACFARGWKFDTKKSLSVFETQELSAVEKRLTSMVAYPFDSNYAALSKKLAELKKEKSDQNIIDGIRYILRDGQIPENLNIDASLERFLTTLTYHLFGTEVVRNPSSLIHNILALDLVERGERSFDWFFDILPMGISGAVNVSRNLQNEGRYELPYYYDYASPDALKESNKLQFAKKELDLIKACFVSKSIDADSVDYFFIRHINNLCYKYYDICIMKPESNLEFDHFFALIDAMQGKEIKKINSLLDKLPNNLILEAVIIVSKTYTCCMGNYIDEIISMLFDMLVENDEDQEYFLKKLSTAAVSNGEEILSKAILEIRDHCDIDFLSTYNESIWEW